MVDSKGESQNVEEEIPLNTHRQCRLIDRFSMKEKVLMRGGWLGFMAVALYGIAKQDPFWASVYGTWCVLGFAVAVLPVICARCPYPSEFNTCLFLPPRLLRAIYPYREGEMSLFGKISSFIALVGMAVIPFFWLIRDPLLLILYLAIGLPVWSVFPAYYCRRCRNFGCPANRAEPCGGI